MKVKVDGAALTAAVSQVSRATGSKHCSLFCADDTIIVSASEKGRSFILRVPAAVKEEGSVTVLPETLTGVVARRKEVVLELSDDESTLTVKSGNYKSTLTVLPFEEIAITEPEGIEMDMADAEMRVLMDVCNKAQLTQPYKDGAPPLPLLIRFGTNGTHVASLDQYHVASVRTKQIVRDEQQDIVLPPGALATVASAANGNKYRVILSESVIYANNEQFELVMPLEQPEGNNLGFTHVKMMQDRIQKEENVTSVSIDFGELDAILSNIFAVSEAGVPIVFSYKKGELTVSTNTNYGSASETLEAKVAGKAGEGKFNPAMLSETLANVSGDTIELNFLPNCVYVQIKNGETSVLYILLRSA